MTETESPVTPTLINLHRKSRMLEVGFSDESDFNYPCEYLRVFAPSDTAQTDAAPVDGKRRVNIANIEADGDAGLRLHFDDDFADSYAWSLLHELGVNQQSNWNSYLQRLEANGLARGAAGGKAHVKLVYFIELAKIAGCDDEDVEIPASVNNVQTLLAWLRKRGDHWNEAFADDKVQVTVNKHFAELFTLVEDGDEVALVPRTR